MRIFLYFIILMLCLTDNSISSNLYYVYGNDSFEPVSDGDTAYHPEKYGSILLGTANKTQTFYGTYRYYFITTYSGDIGLIDAVQASDGTYLSSHITGNTPDYWESWNAPDGVFAHVGANGNGGALVFDLAGEQLTSITVFSAAPFYCDHDNDGYYDSSEDGYCIGDGCIPSGCRAEKGDDCNDSLISGSNINPDAPEICDQIDNNCDGNIDEGLDQQNTINGTVYYNGILTGTIYVGTENAQDSSIFMTTISEPGEYQLTVSDGTYHYVVAQIDSDQSGGFSIDTFQQSEPSGAYDGPCYQGAFNSAITIPNCFQSFDIYLTDFIPTAKVHNNFLANSLLESLQDMDFQDDALWISTVTNGSTDVVKINPNTGELIESIDLTINDVTSIEWIDSNNLWICHKGTTAWEIKKYAYDGTGFTLEQSIPLPSSMDSSEVWSINIAWDGHHMWCQEKQECGSIYKIDLDTEEIIETILADQFRQFNKVGPADVSDICFSDGYLWAMDDDAAIFVKIDPQTLKGSNYTFDPENFPETEGGKNNGMVKTGNLFFFLKKVDEKDPEGNVTGSNYKILKASLDQCIFKTITMETIASQFGQINCAEPTECKGDVDFDRDIDGLDLWDIISCLE